MEGLEEDIKEVDSLLSVAVRPLVRGRLALLLSDLQQVVLTYLLYTGCVTPTHTLGGGFSVTLTRSDSTSDALWAAPTSGSAWRPANCAWGTRLACVGSTEHALSAVVTDRIRPDSGAFET